jgi:hypothetical protein
VSGRDLTSAEEHDEHAGRADEKRRHRTDARHNAHRSEHHAQKLVRALGEDARFMLLRAIRLDDADSRHAFGQAAGKLRTFLRCVS